MMENQLKDKIGHARYFQWPPIVTPIGIVVTDVPIDLLPGEVVHVGTVVARPVRKLPPKYLPTDPAHKILLQKDK